jgi:hypothetical protein
VSAQASQVLNDCSSQSSNPMECPVCYYNWELGDWSCTEMIFVCTWVLPTFNQGLLFTDFAATEMLQGSYLPWRAISGNIPLIITNCILMWLLRVQLNSRIHVFRKTLADIPYAASLIINRFHRPEPSPRRKTSSTIVSLDHIPWGILSRWSASTVESFQVLHYASTLLRWI